MVTHVSNLNYSDLLRTVSTVLISAVMFTGLAKAEVAKGPKRSAREWGEFWETFEEPNLSTTRGAALISRIAVVKKSADGFTVLPLEQSEASTDSFLQVPEERQIALSRFVNKGSTIGKLGQSKSNPCEMSYQAIATCWALDAILDVSGKNWILLRHSGKSNLSEKLVEAPAGSGSDYFKWIHSNLNYDGVIIDSEGDYLLVLLPPGRAGSDIQALTLQDSAGRIVLPRSSIKGTSLLQSIQRAGRFAVFMPVITTPDSAKAFKKGSKLIIEKGN